MARRPLDKNNNVGVGSEYAYAPSVTRPPGVRPGSATTDRTARRSASVPHTRRASSIPAVTTRTLRRSVRTHPGLAGRRTPESRQLPAVGLREARPGSGGPGARLATEHWLAACHLTRNCCCWGQDASAGAGVCLRGTAPASAGPAAELHGVSPRLRGTLAVFIMGQRPPCRHRQAVEPSRSFSSAPRYCPGTTRRRCAPGDRATRALSMS